MIRRHPIARKAIFEQAAYFEQTAGLDLAERFLTAVEGALTYLQSSPHVGTPWPTRDLRLVGLRVWPVGGFRNHRIFYRPIDDGIEVLHVLHAVRDLPAVLEGDTKE